MSVKKFSNITDPSFWNARYKNSRLRCYSWDPYYGRQSLLKATLSPWIKKKRDVLELGCASSRYLMFFKVVAGLETYGLDFSQPGVDNFNRMAA